jgi:hypothetical protein
VKQQALIEYARLYDLKILVESGTYYGDMVNAMMGEFDRVYSIELSPKLFEKARRRFRHAPNVELIQGDSGEVMAGLVDSLTEATLFWLDGHYSGDDTAKGVLETPIYEELRHILDAPKIGHVVLIDDARLFGTDPAYPTLEELRAFVHERRPDLELVARNDSIRITPRID